MTVIVLLPHSGFVRRRGAPGRRGGQAERGHHHFDWNDRYNLWSGLIGGMFLALSYFGCDQSQVQRYLTGKSIAQSKLSLLFNAVAKIPMQFFILFIGAMVFVFYIFVSRRCCSSTPSWRASSSARVRGVADELSRGVRARREAALALVEARPPATPRRERADRRLPRAQQALDAAAPSAAAWWSAAAARRASAIPTTSSCRS
jgi:hypothetical protein